MGLRKDELISKAIDLGINLSENIEWDNTKLVKKLGDYTLSKMKHVSWGRRFVQSMETVQLCKHMKDELKNFQVSPLESDDFVSEFKMNGCRCCSEAVLIDCDDGKQRTIKEIVDNRLPVSVLSYNVKNDKLEYKPVINWMINGKRPKTDWVRVKCDKHGQSMEVTKDHKFFTYNRGYIEAQDLTLNDELSWLVEGLNSTQIQVLYGLFLGEGCIQTEKRNPMVFSGNRICMAHSIKQADYLYKLNNTFGKYSKSKVESYISGYGTNCLRSTTSPIPELNSFVENMYELCGNGKRRKIVTMEFLNNLDWLSLAIWYMDDGTLLANKDLLNTTNKYCRASIATNKFNEKERELIQGFFLTKGFKGSYTKSKDNSFVFSLDSKTSQTFFEKIAPYIPESMEYKLPLNFRSLNKIEWWKDNKLIMKNVKVKGVKVQKDIKNFKKAGRKTQQTYDIEVAGNHNFFANKLLVHNCIICYDPEEGFEFFSRKESVETFLNNDFTRKVYLIKDGIVKEPQDFINKFSLRFVLDSEITVDGDTDFEGQHYENMEDYLQAVLGSLPARAKDFQLKGHKLRFTVFDAMYFEKNPEEAPRYDFSYDSLVLGPKHQYISKELTSDEINWVETHFGSFLYSCGHKVVGKKKAIPKLLYKYLLSLRSMPKYDIRRLSFYKRREIRKALVNYLNKNGLPFYEVEGEDKDKIGYLESVLSNGDEGIILKALDAPYISALKSSRSHKACMKVKQSISELMKDSNKFEDFDVFITGANPPKSDRIKDMIGSLSCSIYLKDEFGNTEIHEIANVSGLSHEWKKKLAQINKDGKITLNPKYLDKVIAVDGMALSHTSLRFQHAKLKEENLIFKDKNPIDCVWDKSELEKMIIVRGRK